MTEVKLSDERRAAPLGVVRLGTRWLDRRACVEGALSSREYRVSRRQRARALWDALRGDGHSLCIDLCFRARPSRSQSDRRRVQHRQLGRSRDAPRRARSPHHRRRRSRCACRHQCSGRESPVGVLGTAGTIASGAYTRAVASFSSRSEVIGQPAPLLVALAEEGWTEGDVPQLVVRRLSVGFLR